MSTIFWSEENFICCKEKLDNFYFVDNKIKDKINKISAIKFKQINIKINVGSLKICVVNFVH